MLNFISRLLRYKWERYKNSKDKAHLAHCISGAQLCIENSAKSILACVGIPSKSHDPSEELIKIVHELSSQLNDVLVSKDKERRGFVPDFFEIYGSEYYFW